MADMDKMVELFKGAGNNTVTSLPTDSSDILSAGDDSAPLSSGMAIPTNKDGMRASARIQVHLALNVLGKALTSFDNNEDEDAKAILSVMNSLVSKFGNTQEKELVPAQIMELVKSEPSLRGMSAQQPQQPQPPQGV